MIEKESLAE